jgi:hypothetical protein
MSLDRPARLLDPSSDVDTWSAFEGGDGIALATGSAS